MGPLGRLVQCGEEEENVMQISHGKYAPHLPLTPFLFMPLEPQTALLTHSLRADSSSGLRLDLLLASCLHLSPEELLSLVVPVSSLRLGSLLRTDVCRGNE